MDVMDHRPKLGRVPAAAVASLLLAATVTAASGAEAYVSSTSLRRSSAHEKTRYYYSPAANKKTTHRRRREDGSPVTLHLFPASPNRVRRRPRSSSSSSSSLRPGGPSSSSLTATGLPATMSPSVLADENTLPSFRTAHGLLSPEVVRRIADGRANDGDGLEEGEPLHGFLKMYRSRGPVACLSFLSDPRVLPELVEAMREIA